MTPREKFLLFVGVYTAALQNIHAKTALSQAREIHECFLDPLNAESRAYDFALWMANEADRPPWLPQDPAEIEKKITAWHRR